MRWLTEESYSGRAKDQSVDKIYSLQARQEFCVLSSEPNSKFDSVLRALESRMQGRGFKVKVKTNTAVSDKFSRSMIYIDDVSTHSYGTSLLSEKKVNFGGKLIKICIPESEDTHDWILEIAAQMLSTKELVMANDIRSRELLALAKKVAERGVNSAVFTIVEFPVAKEQARDLPTIDIGKFHGTIWAETPKGSKTV